MAAAAEWMNALAAFGALAAAVWAALTTRRLYRIESERDQIAEIARRREQASRVSAWAAVRWDETGSRRDGIVIQNESTSPVFDVKIESEHHSEESYPLTLTVLPPGTYFAAKTSTKYHWEFPDAVSQLEGVIRPIMKKPQWKVISLAFADASGDEWARTERGILVEA